MVGALQEDSSATGVNGDQSDDSQDQSGAAYALVRNGTSWSHAAYLKASNTELGDRFGAEVALSEGTLIVAAPDEDSQATGGDGDQLDNSDLDAGAAYAFDLHLAGWSNFGTGWPGATGVPDLTLNAPPLVDTTVQVRLGNATGLSGNALSFLFAGPDPSPVPLPTVFGGSLLVDATTVVRAKVPPAGLDLDLDLTGAPSGLTVYVQLLQLDPGASVGLSFSRGLRIQAGE